MICQITKKELYLKALRNEEFPALTWAPNFDWWYSVNKGNDTLPDQYKGLSNNDIIRAVGGTIWRRVGIIKSEYDRSIRITSKSDGTLDIVTYETPVGSIRKVYENYSDSSKSEFLKEHLIKKIEDVKVVKYIVESTKYVMDLREYYEQLKAVGDDGIVLTCLSAIPYLQVTKTDIGFENAFYMMADYPEEVDGLIMAYHKSFLESYKLADESPVEVISNGDNMDYWTCPPDYFKKYAIPFYYDVRKILHEKNKLAQGHWCGRIQKLVELIGDCGLDIVEALTPKPMTDLDFVRALNKINGKVVVQGGIPSVLMCKEGGTREDLIKYMEEMLYKIGKRKGFVLGMGDNVPVNADFERVNIVSRIVKKFNKDIYGYEEK